MRWTTLTMMMLAGCGDISRVGRAPEFSPMQASYEHDSMYSTLPRTTEDDGGPTDQSSLWTSQRSSLLGDQIDIVFTDTPGQPVRGTVSRFLSDQQEGFGPEVEDYAFCWVEIRSQDQDDLPQTHAIELRADRKYFMDGREVEIRKYSPSS